MEIRNRDTLLKFSASTILGLVDGISAVVAERSKDNEAYITMLLMLYHIILSTFCPTNYSSIYSATDSVTIPDVHFCKVIFTNKTNSSIKPLTATQ